MSLTKFLVVTFTLLSLSIQVMALETDQYLSWNMDLQDSKEVVNNYVNSKMLFKLTRQSVQSADSCILAARRIVRTFRRPFFQLIEEWAENNPALDVYPARDFAGSYVQASIYKKHVFPYIFPMARTMSVNGIYFGTDKLGHFISFGVRYFDVYTRAKKHGLDEKAALEKMVRFGIMSEVDLVGKLVTGVISFADMEANFQGMLFFRSLCETDSPFHLEKGPDHRWELSGKFDIAKYVNPDWDESYNESGITKARWTGKLGVNQTLKPYCAARNSALVIERFRYYQTNFSQSFSQLYLRELEDAGLLNHRKKYNFHSACSL